MYHTNTEKNVQEEIIQSFGVDDGIIRVLIATIAYGMGVDCKGVYNTIIFGHPADVDDYVQMAGRIGRDGKASRAITVQYPGGSAGRTTSEDMKAFLKGDRCRREIIREVFDTVTRGDISPQNCCDVCSQNHLCEEPDIERRLKDTLRRKEVGEEFPLNVPSEHKVTKLEMALEEYRLSLVDNQPDHIYCGADIASGLPRNTVEKIVKECVVEYQYDAFVNRYAFPNRNIAEQVWTLLCTVLERSPSKTQTRTTSMEEDSEQYESSDVEEEDDEYQEPVVYSHSDSD